MILQALAQYYHRISQDAASGVAPEGFESRAIRFVILLDQSGHFKGLLDRREGEPKSRTATDLIVSKAVIRTSTKIAANLLWDNAAYVFGRPKPDANKSPQELLDRARKQHADFITRIRGTFPMPTADEGVSAVLKFLEGGDFGGVFRDPHWKEIEAGGANISFRLEDSTDLICQSKAVKEAIAAKAEKADDGLQQCLVSGEMDSPALLHDPIKGVWQAQSSGARIVSFNIPASESFRKSQGLNAPVGRRAEHAYITALNRLLTRGSHQRMQVGDASTVFWAEKPHEIEDSFSSFFGLAPSGESIQDTESIRALYRAPHSGAPPLESDGTRFYVLGLSPNASRLSVRFWYQGTVGEVRDHVKRHFDDCHMVHRDGEPEHSSLHALLASTAPPKRKDHKKSNVQPNLAGDVMMSILAGTPYPATLLSSIVRRIKAEQAAKTKAGKPQPNVTYPRASLIKACLVRDARYYRKNEKEVSMALDPENTNVGYRLGRLFSVLEKIQEEANPRINATIRDRFYGAASSTPATGFFVPMKLKNHHLAKLENRGRAVNLDKLIGEIMDGIIDFPTHLSLADQGRFAVGYYHQRQSLFTKKNAAKEE